MDVKQEVKHFGVVGDPIFQSKSPIVHRAAYSLLGVHWTYDRFLVNSGGLFDFLSERNSDWAGLSVTMPLKPEAFNLAYTSDITSQRIGASNTLLFEQAGRQTRYHAYNTDVPGLRNALRNLDWTFGDSASIFGGGSTAKSSLLALHELGIQNVSVLVRNPSRTVSLQDLAKTLDMNLVIISSDDLKRPNDTHFHGLVINTLPFEIEASKMNLTTRHFSATTQLYQVSYGEAQSSIVKLVEEQNGASSTGLSMLMEQALLQLRLFHSGDVEVQLPREFEIIAAMKKSLSSVAK